MFNNLIESSSHTREFKRRGSFLLFTTAAYGLLFATAGVVSIYAYDAHLDSQANDLDVVVFVPPPPPTNVVTPVRPNAGRPDQTTHTDPHVLQPVRTDLFDRADNPNNIPKNIGTAPPPVKPAPPGSVRGPGNWNPSGWDRPGNGNGTGPGDTLVNTHDIGTPPPPPTPKPAPQIIKKSYVINGEAIELPKPPYPPLAKQTRIQGTVNVQVLIDESGHVVSAHAVFGNPFLIPEAVKAAYRARFSPTKVGDQPVKVSGVITYNFVLN